MPRGRRIRGGAAILRRAWPSFSPRALADLRKAFHPDVKKRIVAELGKDLTNHPLYDIEKHLLNA